MSAEVLMLLCTCPDEATGERIARALVEERLAACVNCLPRVRSTYRWEGAVRQEEEVLLTVKTTRIQYPHLEMRLKALHPYEVPEIIAVPVVAGLAEYLSWVARETGS